MKRWPRNVLSSEEIFTSPWLKLRSDTIKHIKRLNEWRRIVATVGSWVAVLPVTNGWEIYLLKHHFYSVNKYWYSLVGWRIENWDSNEETVRKELLEEAWMYSKRIEFFISTNPAPAQINWNVDLFFAYDLEIGNQQLEEMEWEVEVVKILLVDALAMVISWDIFEPNTCLMIYEASRRTKV